MPELLYSIKRIIPVKRIDNHLQLVADLHRVDPNTKTHNINNPTTDKVICYSISSVVNQEDLLYLQLTYGKEALRVKEL